MKIEKGAAFHQRKGQVTDMYAKSYADQTGAPGGGYRVAEVRAEAYRRMYEVCNEHHNCTNVIAHTETERADEPRTEKAGDEKIRGISVSDRNKQTAEKAVLDLNHVS